MNSITTVLKIINSKTTFITIICWIIFISYELGIVYFVQGKIEEPFVYLIYYPINIAFFYSCVSILKFTFNGPRIKYISGPLFILVIIILYLLVKGLADFILDSESIAGKSSLIYFQGFFQRNIYRGLYFAVLATFYWSAGHIGHFRRQASAAERQKLIIEKEKAELENLLTKSKNAYLQQQLSPHMLFNTLNFVYNSVQRYSEDAARSIFLLSEIMRFSLKGTASDEQVLLEDEADQIENLLEINRYRFKDPVYIDISMEGNFHGYKIIPLILLTLTENVFKHGNLLEETQPATIRLTVDDQRKLTYSSSNLKKSKNGNQRGQHLGLQNIRIRLDSVYPENYQLDIRDTGNLFELSLTLNL